MKFAKYFVSGLFLSTLAALPAQAYLSVAESGELVQQGKYQIGLEPQFLTNKTAGTNVNVFLDTAFNDSTSGRISMGGGVVDFNAFASVKWIPFPDVDNQPAMGVRFGAGVARDEDQNILQIQVAPLASKKYQTDYGLAVPYIAVPFTWLNLKNENVMASNIVFGSEFHYHEWHNVKLGAELGVELNKSRSYISIFASIPFDGQSGFGK